jgi:hypothetical protein
MPRGDGKKFGERRTGVGRPSRPTPAPKKLSKRLADFEQAAGKGATSFESGKGRWHRPGSQNPRK